MGGGNSEQHQALLMSDDDEEGLGFGENGPESKDKLRHPIVAVFHVLFRAAAILVYLFGGFFFEGYISIVVTVLVLLCLDFWTVKNVTGRIMVGLRWWNQVDEEGKSQWVFESRNKGGRGVAGGRAPERKVFWTCLIAAPIVWFLLCLSSFFTFRIHWTLVSAVGLGLSGANLYGYIRCKLGHTPGLSDATGIVSKFVMKSATQSQASQASTSTAQNSFTGPTVQSV